MFLERSAHRHSKNSKIVTIGGSGIKLWQFKSKACRDTKTMAINGCPLTSLGVIASDLVQGVTISKEPDSTDIFQICRRSKNILN